ncbi:multiple inositol polyphosphate phosphatase 1-like [Panulirus ornatus]|uniref:multiple inositol polyphosphate phosphatase 1-like n=1 Tax=Panulirus ornatus TaxID=150431 RepID=UPI003A8C2830
MCISAVSVNEVATAADTWSCLCQQFYKVCDKYVAEVDENPKATLESQLFKKGPVMAAVVNRVSLRLGLSLTFQKVEVMYDACRFYKAWNPSSDSAWCAVFTPSDLQVLEDWQDLEKYYTSGYGHAINYEMACPPLQDVIQYFSDMVDGRGGPKGIFYFTHSRAVITMMSRLGLYRDVAPLTHEHMDPDRHWRTSSHGIFATNLAFVLSSCGQDRWWVSVLMSEKVVSLDGCSSDRGCTWDEFLAAYGRYYRCDFDNICQASVQEEEPLSSAANRPEVVWATDVLRVLRTLAWWAGGLFT